MDIEIRCRKLQLRHIKASFTTYQIRTFYTYNLNIRHIQTLTYLPAICELLCSLFFKSESLCPAVHAKSLY